jgi:hypothetical protein
VHHAVENVRRMPCVHANVHASLAAPRRRACRAFVYHGKPRPLASGAQPTTMLVPTCAAKAAIPCHGKHRPRPAAC